MVLFKKHNKEKELELKPIPKSGPDIVSPSEIKNTEEHISHLTDTLMGKTKETSEKIKHKDDVCDSDDFKFFKVNSDDDSDIDNIV